MKLKYKQAGKFPIWSRPKKKMVMVMVMVMEM
jgi:hypothetical protein